MEQKCLLYRTTGSIKQKEVRKLFSPELRDEGSLHLSSPSGQCARLVTNEEMLGWPLWLPTTLLGSSSGGPQAQGRGNSSHDGEPPLTPGLGLFPSARTPHQTMGPPDYHQAEPLLHLVPMLHIPSSFGQRPGELE